MMYIVKMKTLRSGVPDEDIDAFRTLKEVEDYKRRMRCYFFDTPFDESLIGFEVTLQGNDLSCEVHKKHSKCLKLYLNAIGVQYSCSECDCNIIFSFDKLTEVDKHRVDEYLDGLCD